MENKTLHMETIRKVVVSDGDQDCKNGDNEESYVK